jgi:membrane protein YdbS with pleckstrin-like domain
VALSLAVVWLACLTLQMADFKLNKQPTGIAFYSIAVLIVFAFVFLNPCNFIYKTVRVQVLKTLE